VTLRDHYFALCGRRRLRVFAEVRGYRSKNVLGCLRKQGLTEGEMDEQQEKPPFEGDIRFWSVVVVIWACLVLGAMNIATKIHMIADLFSYE
jgi:hypothetical protein